jgi:hypothetical protein
MEKRFFERIYDSINYSVNYLYVNNDNNTMINNKQTAVEWLVKIYLQTNKIDSFDIEQAKEKEKQQIMDAYNNGDNRSADLYYNETYGSKGSDDHIVDTNEMVDQVPDVRKMVEDDNYLTPVDWLMDRIKWIHRETYDYLIKEGQYDVAKRTENAILDKANEIQSSQTEISDEEWKKIVKEINKQPMIFVPNEISDEEIEKEAEKYPYGGREGSKRMTFMDACKWYREQLKKKQ